MDKIKQARLAWMDMAKGIAIILMIIGHSDKLPSYIRGFIFSFHMPLFMIINGYLIKNYDIKQTFKKSCHTLLRPYIIVCLIQAAISMFSASDITQAGVNLFNVLDDMMLGLSKTSGILTNHSSI